MVNQSNVYGGHPIQDGSCLYTLETSEYGKRLMKRFRRCRRFISIGSCLNEKMLLGWWQRYLTHDLLIHGSSPAYIGYNILWVWKHGI